MKYMWIAMLAIVFIAWAWSAVKDIWHCHRTFRKGYEHWETETWMFVLTITITVFVYSIGLWLKVY